LVETATRIEPLHDESGGSPGCAAVSLAAAPPATRLAIHARDAEVDPLGRALGIALPPTLLRAAIEGELAVLHLGPDEWLLIAPDAGVEALATTAAGLALSVVDVSHRQTGIVVSGPQAVDALNAFCALDLDPTAFPVAMATRTLFGKADIVLWRTAAASFRIEVARSFAPYVWACLEEARHEYLD
jgi:sarcosine oxidase subunit gamma